jgi:hypothetical protein
MAWQFLRAFEGTDTANPDFTWLSMDLGSFLLPSFLNSFLGSSLGRAYARLTAGPFLFPQEHTAFLGFTVLGLACLALRRREPATFPRRLFVAIALVFGILALGSELRVLGLATGIPLPAALLDHVPVLRLARAPGRYAVLVSLALSVLAGAGFEALRRRALRALLAGLAALEFLAVPLPLFDTRPGPVYARLAQVPGDYAVLELPLEARDGQHVMGRLNPRQALGQTRHGHPTVGGMVSRLPPATFEAIFRTPLVSTLLDDTGVTQEAAARDRAEARLYFVVERIGAVVIHPAEAGGARQRYLESLLPIAARESFPDGTLLLWVEGAGPVSARPQPPAP